MNEIRRVLLGGLALPLAGPLGAQEKYPSRPVTMIVPFPPGGVAGIVSRALAPSLEAALGQTVIVVNKAGAGGAIGAATVAAAKPDGYTLLMGLASISTLPEQEILNERPAAFQLDQLVALGRMTIDPMMLAVRAESRYQTLADFLDDARKRPGAVSYASSGVYGVYHVATEMIAHGADIKLLHVPYAGGAPALAALMGGEVDAGLVTTSVGTPQLKSGRIRPLAALTPERWLAYPDTPTLAEAGIDANYTLWTGVFAPAGTPSEVLGFLDATLGKAAADPKFTNAIETTGASMAYLDAARFGEFWQKDSKRLIDALRRIGKIR